MAEELIGPGDEVFQLRALVRPPSCCPPGKLAVQQADVYPWHFCDAIVRRNAQIFRAEEAEGISANAGRHRSGFLSAAPLIAGLKRSRSRSSDGLSGTETR